MVSNPKIVATMNEQMGHEFGAMLQFNNCCLSRVFLSWG
jgi:hypothetical protein